MWSFHSLQKSDRERIAPVAHYKRATVSDSFTSLFRKKWKYDLLKKTSESLFRSQKTKNKSNARISSPVNELLYCRIFLPEILLYKNALMSWKRYCTKHIHNVFLGKEYIFLKKDNYLKRNIVS